MKYYWYAFWAALGDVQMSDFLDIMRRMLTGAAPPPLDDKFIEGEVEEGSDNRDPRQDWELFRKKMGDAYIKYHEETSKRLDKATGIPEQRAKVFQGRIDTLSEERAGLLRTAQRMSPYLFLGTVLFLGALLSALAELGCLWVFLREWLVPMKMTFQDKLMLGTVSLMMFGALTGMAHLILEGSPGVRRNTLAASYVGICILLGGYRAYTTVDGLGAISACLLFAFLTGLMPIMTAKLLRLGWSNINIWSERRLPFDQVTGVSGHYAAMLDREESIKTTLNAKIESRIAKITDAYLDGPRIEKAKREAGREFRRGLDAELAKYELAFRFWTRWAKLVPAAAAAIAALLLLTLSGSLHAEPINIGALCDRSSSSGQGLACSEDTNATATRHWAEMGAVEGAGHFEVILVGHDVGSTVVFYSTDVPTSFPPPYRRSQRKWIEAIVDDVRSKRLPLVADGSAIAEAIYREASRLHDHEGAKWLIIMSDMRQITRGRFNFERKVPSPEEFAPFVQHDVPADLSGIHVRACGFHPTTPNGRALAPSELEDIKRVWQLAFKTWGTQNAPISEQCIFERDQ